MKLQSLTRTASLASACLSSALLQMAAQSTGPQPATATDSDIVVLSPFVIQSERDTGYQATSTLAGTRINTSLKDIGAAVSVYTKDFMRDIGATNAQDLLVYATGAEVGGMNGNFLGTGPAATNVASDGLRNNPQGSTRIRGLASAQLARGYFSTDIGFDDYNTSEVTVNRGPNAVLFGLGSPAGIINQGLIQPNYHNRASLTQRFSSNTTSNFSSRTTLDVNQSLIGGKLAVRIAGLYEDERFKQKPAYERDRRAYAALIFEPMKSTALRVNYERGDNRANRPSPLIALDSISPWFASGKYLYDYAGFDRNSALNAGTAPQIPTSAQGRVPRISPSDTLGVFYDDPSSGTISRAIRLVIPSAQLTAQHPAINVDGQPENYFFYGSANLSDFTAGYRDQGFTPENIGIFDWENHMFDGSTSLQTQEFSALNVSIEQRALQDRVGVQVAFDRQTFLLSGYNPFSTRAANYISVDINTTLSNGQPNPNVGRPFVTTGPVNRNEVDRTRETRQATAFARFDFNDVNDRLGFWLGRHSLTGLVQEEEVDELNFLEKLVLDSSSGVLERLFGASERVQPRQINRLIYVGPSILNAGSIRDVQLQPINVPIFTPGLAVMGEVWDPAVQNFVPVAATTRGILNAGTLSRTEVKSMAGVLQSHWLKDHLVTIVGWRQDKTARDASSPPTVPSSVNPNNPFTFDGWVLPGTPLVEKLDGWSQSVVLKVPQGWTGTIPGFSELSFFFNKSENFASSGGRVDYLGRQLANPTGQTREYGLNFELAAGRFNLRLNRFETDASNITGTNLINNTANNFLALVGDWEVALHNFGATAGIQQSDLTRLTQGNTGLIEEMKSVWAYSFVVNPQGIASRSQRIPAGQTDTTDFVAKGYEADIIYNATRNWRFLLNVAKHDTIQSNIGPVVQEFMGLVRGNLDAVGNLPRNGVSGTTVAQTFGPLLYVPYDQLISQTGVQAFDQRKWRVNLVSNYTFSNDGRLNGWSVGGGFRWQDGAVIGYPLTGGAPDLNRPVKSDADLNVDAWIGYERRDFLRGVDLRVQLNARNIVASDELIPVTVQPDGSISQYRLPNYATWSLSTTLSF